MIDDVNEVLVDELYWLYFIGNGMIDQLFHPIMDVLGLIDYG